MIKKIIVFLRPIKYLIRLFFHSPKYLYEKVSADFKKDLHSKKLKKNFHIIWCVGLPKSGTTLIEEILRELPMVQANNSVFRIYDDSNLDHVHGISEQMFNKFPKNKLSFLKTHSHFSENYINIANKYNSKIIISVRDIRDAMISRYFHAMNDETFFQYDVMKSLNFNEGFIMSLKKSIKKKYNASDWETDIDGKFKRPIEYYYKWIQNWQNYAKNNANCLILWFEEFVKNPKDYIQKIVNYLELSHIDIDKIYFKLESNKKLLRERDLKDNLNQFQPQTFRKGTSGDWRKVLDNETLEEFYSILPDNISKIEYKSKS